MHMIKLMADYQSYPLWWADGSNFGDIDPTELPITPELANGLLAWADRFDATYNSQDPGESGFDSAQAAAEFDLVGQQLWQQLRTELSSDYNVLYQSFTRGQLLTDPAQLKTLPTD